jgi:hypothetical protein
MRMFEKGWWGLRGIFGHKMEEGAGGWRRLHNEELHKLYASPHIIRAIKARRVRWAVHVARMGDKNSYVISVGKPAGKRPLWGPRQIEEYNIKMDFNVDCIRLGIGFGSSEYSSET